MPLDTSIKKVLVIGSGPIVIGQAAEFDYAGAQACRVLKEAGVNVVLCNSNPATIMTDQAMADEIYLEPLTVETIKRIIKKERPDSILAGLGGQTGLTLAMQLDKEGFLEREGVRLLGTDAKAISRAEDRELFKEAMAEIGQPVIASDIAETVEGALAVAESDLAANPEAEDFDSLADYMFTEDGVEIRIPWQLLNFANPSEMMIHDDYYENYGVEYIHIDEMYVGMAAGDATEFRIPMAAFALEGWGKAVTYHERLKESYYILQEYWAGLDG